LAFFGKGAGGFVEVLGQIKLQRRGLHLDLALELVLSTCDLRRVRTVARTESAGFFATSVASS
jgi:hypothetical protein